MNEKFLGIYQICEGFTELDAGKPEIHLSDEQYLQEKRVCRFCGKDSSATSFGKKAHAISENVGNKKLISDYECDDCNKKFGEFYEDSFGKYIQPFKMVSQIFGKKNSLKYINKNKRHRVEIKKTTPLIPEFNTRIKGMIIDSSIDKFVTINNENEVMFNFERQGYNSYYVYASLQKMAYSIMPFADFPNFISSVISLKFAINEDTSEVERSEILIKAPNVGFLEYVPGINPFRNLTAQLYKRRNDFKSTEFPYFVFKLSFGNYSLQIPVPSDNEMNGNTMNFIPYQSFKESTLEKIYFNVCQPFYSCPLSVKMVELDEMTKKDLEAILKTKGLL